jgi:hypothetical protein
MMVPGGEQDIRLFGPDDVELLLCPSADGYFWRILNGGLKKIQQVQLELSSVQTFDERKRAFRELVGVGFRWPVLGLVPAGDLSSADAFLSVATDRLRVWNSISSPFLPWPSGDPNPRRRWLLKLRVTGLSEHWPIELELQWTVGSKTIELRQFPQTGSSLRAEPPPAETESQRGAPAKSWAEIESKKYGEIAMAMIHAANLNHSDFVQEACPPTFRIRHLRTQDYFAFGGENGGAMWSRPGYSRDKARQTSRSQRLESWETKIKHFEGWLKELLEFLAAVASASKPTTPLTIGTPVPQSIHAAKGTMGDLASWKGLRAAFAEHAEQDDDLHANYDSLDPGGWNLHGGSPRFRHKFKELGSAAAAKVGLTSDKGNGEPWQLWLEYMWAEGWRGPEKTKLRPAPVPGERLSWSEQKKRAEEGERTLFHVFQTSADCCGDLGEREVTSPRAGELPPEPDGPRPPGATAVPEPRIASHDNQTDHARGRQSFKISRPDDIELLIDPYDDYYVWRIRNGSLRSMTQLRMEVSTARSFDAKKLDFRETFEFKVQWRVVDRLAAGEFTDYLIFISLEGDHLRFGTTNGMNHLSWPTGDPNANRRWLLGMRVVWDSIVWPIDLELRWTLGTKRVELRQSSGLPKSVSVEPGTSPALEPKESSAKAAQGTQKGDLQLLQKVDGSLYEAVAFLTAQAYADISDRRRQQLMSDGTLKVVGQGQNRRITVASLIAYCPPTENPK